jgi:putative ABC transport system substrate-binding protein
MVLSVSAKADQPPRKIAVLAPSIPNSPLEAGLHEGLHELGYVAGKDVTIEWRQSARTKEELRQHAIEVVGAKPDLIVAFGTPAARAALDATSTIPVVFYVGDPVATGFAASLAKPQGNATGVSVLSTELTAKRLDLLHQLVPKARRIAYLVNPSNPLTATLLQEAKKSSQLLGLQLKSIDVRNPAELDAALSSVNRSNTDGVLVTDAFFVADRVKVAKAMRAARLPAMFAWKEDQVDGVLVSYGPSFRQGARRVAAYVDKVLRGTKPSQLPIEQDSKYELIINLRVARELAIEVPQELLLRADELIR